MDKKKPIIFSDFDGSFSENDIGHRLFTHFSGGKNLPLVERWKKGLISSRDCLRAEAELIRVREKPLFAFFDQFRLRSGAAETYRAARAAGIPFYIVSDGTDIYIRYILNKFGLEEIQFFSNHGVLSGDRLLITFPADNGDCRRCGCCKGARIAEVLGRETEPREVIFIGDGLSDLCALPHADIIFARGDLLHYCRTKSIDALEYENFFDILDWLAGTGRAH